LCLKQTAATLADGLKGPRRPRSEIKQLNINTFLPRHVQLPCRFTPSLLPPQKKKNDTPQVNFCMALQRSIQGQTNPPFSSLSSSCSLTHAVHDSTHEGRATKETEISRKHSLRPSAFRWRRRRQAFNQQNDKQAGRQEEGRQKMTCTSSTHCHSSHAIHVSFSSPSLSALRNQERSVGGNK